MTTTTSSWIANKLGAPELLAEPLVAPGVGQVTIDVRAIGINPGDLRMFAAGANNEPGGEPVRPGFEVAGVISAVGDRTEIGSGGGTVGDEVLAFRVSGGYSSAVTVPASDVFAKPPALSFPEAANLLLVSTTAAESLEVTGLAAGETILIHGGSGGVGLAATQLALLLGARVIATASRARFDEIHRFGGEPVEYGPGLEDRIRALAPDGVDVAVDTVGTDEAVDVSLAVIKDRSRVLTIAAPQRAQNDGVRFIGAGMPASAAFRDESRSRMVALAGEGKLIIPVVRTFPFADVAQALALLQSKHPGGKLALIP